ncbi:hypothetical protein DW050_11860, partial [Ruminococcus sp. AF42-10]
SYYIFLIENLQANLSYILFFANQTNKTKISKGKFFKNHRQNDYYAEKKTLLPLALNLKLLSIMIETESVGKCPFTI